MYCLFVRGNDKRGCFGRNALIGLWASLLCACTSASPRAVMPG
jgi:hypothetical protein